MRYEFGAYRVEAGERRVRRGDLPVPLTPKAFDTLLVLMRNAGRAVGKEELLETVWPGTNVAEATLAQNIFTLRKALGGPACIETVPRFGYRFVPAVREVQPVPVKRTLAVLPFENLSRDPAQDYFSDGLTEEMITQLGRLDAGALGVIARTSVMQYRSTQKTIAEIGRDLGVSHVLAGSVRRDGARVRVAAQLFDARDQTHLWAGSYDRDLVDILQLQTDVARAIADQITPALTPPPPRPDVRARVTPEAYETYLRGRFLWNKRTRVSIEEAISLFERAIRADPDSALPYAALGDCYVVLGSQLWIPPRDAAARANEALARALARDPSLAEAHAALGFVRAMYEARWADAEQSFRRALDLNASYATAHHWLSFLLAAVGRIEEALESVRRAAALDPFSPIISTNVGTVLFWARRYDGAIAAYRAVLSREPDFWIARWMLGLAYEQTGDVAGAMTAYRDAVERSGGVSPVLPASLARGLALAGERAEAECLLAEISGHTPVSFLNLAAAHAALGQHDAAFRCLNAAWEQRESWVAFLAVDPRLDALRSDPRYRELARAMHLDDRLTQG